MAVADDLGVDLIDLADHLPERLLVLLGHLLRVGGAALRVAMNDDVPPLVMLAVLCAEVRAVPGRHRGLSFEQLHGVRRDRVAHPLDEGERGVRPTRLDEGRSGVLELVFDD